MHSRLLTAPSVITICKPSLVAAGIRQFSDEQGLSDLATVTQASGRPTPIKAILDHVEGVEHRGADAEVLVEFAGRQCYGAWAKGRELEPYIENILDMKHGSVLEHAWFSFVLTGISRSLSLELIRHGEGTGISQESQRFVDATDAKFVVPPALLHLWGGDTDCADAEDWLSDQVRQIESYNRWQAEIEAMMCAETDVKKRTVIQKRANEAARASLPNAIETKMVWSANARSLRHIISLRGAEDADLEIRRFAAQLAIQCKANSPTIFGDIGIVAGDFNVPMTTYVHEKV